MRYMIVIEEGETSFGAYVPDLEGCVGVADTEAEVKHFNDYAELYKALKTSIGSYRAIFERVNLREKLNIFTEREKIFHPTEGNFEVLSKIEIYNALKSLGKNEITVVDESYETEKELNLNFISLKEFVEKVEYKDY